jgi:membrane associated rhomboid family serine protease
MYTAVTPSTSSCKAYASARDLRARRRAVAWQSWSRLHPGLNSRGHISNFTQGVPNYKPNKSRLKPHSKMLPRINLPPLTRGLLLTLLSLSAVNAALRFRSWSTSTPTNEQSTTAPSIYLTSPQWAIPYLVLIPTKSIKFPWTFLTSALIENNIVSLVISSAVVWFGGKYLERAWGGQEFAKFVLFVTMIPSILTFFIYAVWHGLTAQTPE